MRTVSSCVTDKEYAAIVEFANQYDETVSSVIKKAIFDVAALTHEGKAPAGFVLQTESQEGKDEHGHSLDDVLSANNIDKVRQILGWPELDLQGYKKEGKPSDVKESNDQAAPADKAKCDLEKYAAWLRTEKGKKKFIDEIQNTIHERFQKHTDRIKKLTE